MRTTSIAIAAAFACSMISASGGIITPAGATSSTPNLSNRPIGEAINSSHLSGGGTSGDILSETHLLNTGNGPGYYLSNGAAPVLTFDLGGAHDVDAVHFWNYNRPTFNARSIQSFDLSFSTDGVNFGNAISLSGWTQPTGAEPSIAVTSRTFATQTGVTHVRLESIANFGDPNYTGLSEIRFAGGSAPAGPVDAGTSTVAASPTSVPADGSSTSTITVTLRDASNNPVTGEDVTLANTSGPGTPTISPSATQTTDGSGVASFTVSSSTEGTEVFAATSSTDSITVTQTASVGFTAPVVAGPVDADTSTVEASPTSVAADGSAVSTVTVTLKDAGGLVVAGEEVSLADLNGIATIDPVGTVTTNGSGEATFSVSSTTIGNANLQATVTTSGDLAITQTALVEFTNPGVAVLLGGFDGTNAFDAPIQHASAVGSFDMELTVATALSGGGLTGGTLWGTADLDPDAENGAIAVLISDVPLELVITVTNTSSTHDVTLDRLHWVSKRDAADAPTTATITYFSGSLTDPLGANDSVSLGGIGTNYFDYDLSDLLSDRVLAPGETATFKWTTSGANTGGNDRLRMDNVALSGTFSASDYISWSSGQGWTVGGPNTGGSDDYDLDGLSNDDERLFGLDPRNAGSRNPISTPLDPAAGTFSYTRRTQSLTGQSYPVWFSTDLEEWYRDIHATQTPGAPLNDVETVDVAINPALLAEPRLFLRLGAEPPVTLPAPELMTSWGSQDTITLNFTEELYVLTANDAANFSVELDGGGPVAVTDATLSANKKTVTLTLGSALGLASTYNVTFSNLTGTTGVPLAGGGTVQIQTWDDDPDGIKVFVLAGQSNMVGYGKTEWGGNPAWTPTNGEPKEILGGLGCLRYLAQNNASFPVYDFTKFLENPADPANSAWTTRSDVKLWWKNGGSGNLGGPIEKGDLGPLTNNNQWFGPELGFGEIVGDFYASDDVLIIKTAWGGHNLHTDFRPPSAVAARGGEVGASYLEIFNDVRQVLNNLGTEFPEWSGRGYQIVGFGWHQGTSDKAPSNVADEYKYNLRDFIADVRGEFAKPDLPFVIASAGMNNAGPAEPAPYPGYNPVERAQLWAYPEVPQPANVLSTDTRPFWREPEISPSTTAFHWNHNAETYFLVGKALGDNMVTLLTP